jgi:hypothetical protein
MLAIVPDGLQEVDQEYRLLRNDRCNPFYMHAHYKSGAIDPNVPETDSRPWAERTDDEDGLFRKSGASLALPERSCGT